MLPGNRIRLFQPRIEAAINEDVEDREIRSGFYGDKNWRWNLTWKPDKHELDGVCGGMATAGDHIA